MNPFNPLSIVQSTFESDDVQHELKELVEIIRAYDIYDFLRRLSALNLQKENQNRAVLLDALQSAILYNDETYYTSSAKMSASKFSSIIKKLDSISLVHAIDPNENVFTQNVIFFVTLRQKAVAKILPQLFFFGVPRKVGKVDHRFSKCVL